MFCLASGKKQTWFFTSKKLLKGVNYGTNF